MSKNAKVFVRGASQKRMLGVFILVLVLSLFAFYVYVVKNAPKPQQLPQYSSLEKIRIGNIGEFSIFNIIAQHNGYFAQHGLDASITEYDAGPSAMAALIKGNVDVTVAGDFVGVTTLFTSQQVRILSEVSRQKAFQLLARTDKGIRVPLDLKGKKIGVTKGSAGEFYLDKFLILHNITITDITEVNLPPAQIVAQLKRGTIDAALTFNPHAYNLKKALGSIITQWSAQGEQDTFAFIYALDGFIQAHPKTVSRYLQALYEAEQFVNEHPAQAQKVLVETMHYTPEYVAYIWPNFTFSLGLDQESLLTLETQARFAIDNKLTTKTRVPNYLQYLYFDGLQEVDPSAITIIH